MVRGIINIPHFWVIRLVGLVTLLLLTIASGSLTYYRQMKMDLRGADSAYIGLFVFRWGIDVVQFSYICAYWLLTSIFKPKFQPGHKGNVVMLAILFLITLVSLVPATIVMDNLADANGSKFSGLNKLICYAICVKIAQLIIIFMLMVMGLIVRRNQLIEQLYLYYTAEDVDNILAGKPLTGTYSHPPELLQQLNQMRSRLLLRRREKEMDTIVNTANFWKFRAVGLTALLLLTIASLTFYRQLKMDLSGTNSTDIGGLLMFRWYIDVFGFCYICAYWLLTSTANPTFRPGHKGDLVMLAILFLIPLVGIGSLIFGVGHIADGSSVSYGNKVIRPGGNINAAQSSIIHMLISLGLIVRRNEQIEQRVKPSDIDSVIVGSPSAPEGEISA